jgi:hypothetical protein
MAASVDEIVSMAMEVLGHEPFTSFANTTNLHHKAAERAWPTVRDRLLARHPWNCAIKRVLLDTPDVTPPVFDFSERFPLPADWLRTLKVGSRYDEPEYRIEAGFILVNADQVRLRYIFRQTDVTKYEAHLTDAMVHAVAARMAYSVTGSVSKSDETNAMAERVILAAMAVDAVEEDGETLGDFPLYSARFR